MKTKNPETNSYIEKLIDDLKKADVENKEMMQNAERFCLIIAAFMVFLHVVLLLLPGQESIARDIYTGVSFLLAFLIYSLYFRMYKRDYEKTDYSLTTLEMLKRAAKKQKVFSPRLLLLIIPSLIIAYNVSHSITQRFNTAIFKSDEHNMLFVFGIFILIITLAALSGYLMQRKKQRYYQNRAKALIEEIENDK